MSDANEGLRVIGAGMGRTGTSSLKRALERLGFSPCHHMEEVIANPREVPTWEAAARGEKIDWKSFMSSWGASVDFPSALYYRELMAAFPDAKVILSLRDADSWYDSMAQTIVPTLTRFPNTIIGPRLPYLSGPFRAMGQTKLRRELLGNFSDREHAKKMFTDWNEQVKRTVPKERLLVFQAKEGWEPLCEFLGVPVPEEPFPRVNDTAEFRRRAMAATILSWTLLLAPIALALTLLFWLL